MILPLSKFSSKKLFDNECTTPHYDLLGLFLLPERRACVSSGPRQASTVRQHLIKHPHHFYSWAWRRSNHMIRSSELFRNERLRWGHRPLRLLGHHRWTIESNADKFPDWLFDQSYYIVNSVSNSIGGLVARSSMADNGSALCGYHLITLATRTIEQTLLGGAPWRHGPQLERMKSRGWRRAFHSCERFELSNIKRLR